MKKGVDRHAEGKGLFLPPKSWMVDAYRTIRIMEEAPVTVFLLNPWGKDLREPWDIEETMREVSDIQTLGAVAQNMALMAFSKGVGSLWIGNIFFAYEELKPWLGTGEMVLAMTFGYPEGESPRSYRKPLADVVEWKK